MVNKPVIFYICKGFSRYSVGGISHISGVHYLQLVIPFILDVFLYTIGLVKLID